MKIIIISFLSSLLLILIIDGMWLMIMSKRFYSVHISHLLAVKPNFLPAVIFYLIYSIGITLLVVVPAIQGNVGIFKVFLYGALLGFIAYAAYDLTNQATLKDWPLIVTVIDLLWGAILTGVVSTIAVVITKYFL